MMDFVRPVPANPDAYSGNIKARNERAFIEIE